MPDDKNTGGNSISGKENSPKNQEKPVQTHDLKAQRDQLKNQISENKKPENPFAKVEEKKPEITKRPENPFRAFSEEKKVVVEEKPKEMDVIEAEVVVRNETKSEEKPETSPVTPAILAGEDNLPEESLEDFKSEVWKILDQAGIGKGCLIGILVIVGIGLIFGLIFITGWYRNLNFFGSGTRQVTKTESVQAGGTLTTSYILGLEFAPKYKQAQEGLFPIGYFGSDAGVDAAFILGLNAYAPEAVMIYYTDVLRRMQNMYTTDVYEILNKSTDREGTLAKHLAQMNTLIMEANDIYLALDQEMTRLNEYYSVSDNSRDTSEKLFFSSIQDLQGRNAYNNLNAFIEASKLSSESQAYYNAYGTLKDMFKNSLDALKPRYEDISVNSDALLKGVKVFEVPNSDINAIIRLGEK